MAATKTSGGIQGRVTEIVENAIEEIRSVFIGLSIADFTDDGAPTKRGPGRPPKGTASGGKKRTTSEVTAETKAAVLAYIRKHPGAQNTTKGLQTVASKDAVKAACDALIEERKVKQSGKGRGTNYHAVGQTTSASKANGAKTKAKKSGGKKKGAKASSKKPAEAASAPN